MDAARPVRIRLPLTALIIPAMLLLCTVPIATASPVWSFAYAIPAVALVITVWAGVTANAAALTARWWRGRRRIAWDDLDRLEFTGQRWAVAVTTSGARVLLPGVRPTDVPRIVGAAGGRLFLRRPSPSDDDANDPGPAGTTEAADAGQALEPAGSAHTPAPTGVAQDPEPLDTPEPAPQTAERQPATPGRHRSRA